MITITLAGGWHLMLHEDTQDVDLVFVCEEYKTGVTIGKYGENNRPMHEFPQAIALCRSNGESNTPLN